jgi:alpha-1,2-mannosyltransferase
LNHPRQYADWRLLLVALLLSISVYYWMEWRTFANFVAAIDNTSQFMLDFAGHYYPMGRQILHDPTPVYRYYYTSFFALLLVPVCLLSLPSAMVVWGAIQLVCLLALCIIPARGLLNMRPTGMVLYAALCVTSFPVLHNIRWGQVSVALTVCVIAAFLSYSQNKKVLAGVLLAFAAAIKFYPAIFIVYFILKRDVRTCMAFLLAAVVFYAVFPATVLGFSNWLAFEKAVGMAISSAEWVSHDVNSQYFTNVGIRWFAIIFGRNAGSFLAQGLTIAGYGIALSCIAMVWFLQRRESCEKYGLSMVAIFLSIPFVLKTSWPHYFVYLPLSQAAVFSYYASRFRVSGLRGKALSALPVLSMLLSSVFLFNLFPGWGIYNSYGMLFLSNMFLLVAVYATVVMNDGRIEPDRPISE